MDMAGQREMAPRFGPIELSNGSGLAKNCTKIVPVRSLFHHQRIELAQPATECHMSVIETFAAPAQFPAHIRFVVVNNLVPRTDTLCAQCGTKIEQTYVHELQTRFLYCDAQCLAGYQKTMVPARARRVR